MPPYEEWQLRVIEEKKELADKLDKLCKFVVGEAFKALPATQQNLLNRQWVHMKSYLDVLNERIAAF